MNITPQINVSLGISEIFIVTIFMKTVNCCFNNVDETFFGQVFNCHTGQNFSKSSTLKKH